MNYTKGKQSYLNKNKFIVKVMIMYIEDYEFLYQCIGSDTNRVIFDVEDIVVNLVDLQGDYVYYTPLSIA